MHKLDVVFFASLRESMGVDKVTIEVAGELTIEDIKQQVAKTFDDASPLFDEGIQASVDFNFARPTTKVNPETAKEVAFFPPVTGG